MRSLKSVPRNFRVWPENQERLEFAEKVGLNVSEVINEALTKSLKVTLEAKLKKMREQLAVSVP